MDLDSREGRKSLDPYVGNLLQLGGTRHYCLTDGQANGTRCIDVRTGSGFAFTVVCDRGMDISLASYKAKQLIYVFEIKTDRWS